MEEIKNNGARKGVVVITGASAGVGRACARAFAKKGYDIALIARGIEGLMATQNEVEAHNRNATYMQVDVADAEALEKAADQIEEHLGQIDIWVNNAMNSVFSPVKEMQPQEYKRVTEVTYLGQVYGTLTALKKMHKRNKGSIILVGSALAYRGIPLQSAYCASKHAIQGFFDSLRVELMHDKSQIQVTMVELPALNTTQFGFVKSRLPNKPKPMGTIYQPEVAADAIVFAAEHHRREIQVGFSTLKAIWGNKIAPWFADWSLSRNGIKGQQTAEKEDENRESNLWNPLPGNHGVHGNFSKEAKTSSVTLEMSKHRKIMISGVLLILLLLLLIIIF